MRKSVLYFAIAIFLCGSLQAYQETVSGTASLITGATAQAINSDNTSVSINLPFNFPFYNGLYNSVWISPNGYLTFGGAYNDNTNSQADLKSQVMIAPLWADLVTNGAGQANEDVYVSTSATEVKIRWVAELKSNASPVNFMAVLGSNGSIRFEYGSGNNFPVPPTVGISRGDSLTYLFSFYDGATNLNSVNNSGISTNAPGRTAIVYDGSTINTDIMYISTTTISANWPAATDPEGAIKQYWYAIGTTPGGVDIMPYTTTALTSVTVSTLTIPTNFANGDRCYFSVKAENTFGLMSSITTSDGQIVDTSVPGNPSSPQPSGGVSAVNTATMTFTWTASSDDQSFIALYLLQVATDTATGPYIFNGNVDNVLVKVATGGVTGLTYKARIMARNGAGLFSNWSSDSNGIIVDTTPPTAVSVVDGNSISGNETSTNTITQLGGAWTASSETDPGSSISAYYYSIGTAPGLTDVAGWTNNGTTPRSFLKTGLSLLNGVIYYVNVYTVNNLGSKSAVSSSDGVIVDISSPSAPGFVYDGLGLEPYDYTTSTITLSANWGAASDAQSGIKYYQYAVGTTSGGAETSGVWTNTANTSVTISTLTLANGGRYYFSVRAVNNVGMVSGYINSNGQTVDNTPPSGLPGTPTDEGVYVGRSSAAFSWTSGNLADTDSLIKGYYIQIGNTPSGNNVFDGYIGPYTSTTTYGLLHATTYYIRVRAMNNAGLFSNYSISSDGIMADKTAPAAMSVRDGTDSIVELDFSSNTASLSANWDIVTDTDSGVSSYKYAMGANGVDVAEWTNIGLSTYITKTGLTLTHGVTYYVAVQAVNNAGLTSSMSNPGISDGILIDITAPEAPYYVYDGTSSVTELNYISTNTAVSANWGGARDPESGIRRYWYALGTSAGGEQTVAYTSSTIVSSITLTGFNLTAGTTYYFSVKSENQAGIVSSATSSDGMLFDNSAPSGAPSTPQDYGLYWPNLGLTFTWNKGNLSEPQSRIAGYFLEVGYSVGDTSAFSSDVGDISSKTITGLLPNTTYYARVRSYNTSGLNSEFSGWSDGIITDTSNPDTIATVRDGLTSTDVQFSTSTIFLSANWDVSADVQSGVAKYQYKIGTTSGGDEVRNWTDNGLNISTSVTTTGLTAGNTYYFSVRAVNGAGRTGTAANSDGVLIDVTPPTDIVTVNDGTGADIAYTTNQNSLSANWSASADIQSGIYRYWYAIGITRSGTTVLAYSSTTATTVTVLNLNLTNGGTYYFSVKSENRAGLVGNAASSNGQIVDTTEPTGLPSTPAVSGTYSNSATVTFTWTAGSAQDAQSGITNFYLEVGTSTTANNMFAGDVGMVYSKDIAGCTQGQTYYARVKAKNGVGLYTGFSAASNGIKIDTTAPAGATVREGTGFDISYTTVAASFSANWDPATDDESGISKYMLAIFETNTALYSLDWTDVGLTTYTTKTGLNLANGMTYQARIRAYNNAGDKTETNGSGVIVDYTPPVAPIAVRDGISFTTDDSATSAGDSLSANWPSASDGETGIAKYHYSIGTTAGGIDVLDWTENAASTGVTKTDLALVSGTSYFFNVKAENNAGLVSGVRSSNGIVYDPSVPTGTPAAPQNTGLYPRTIDGTIYTSTTTLTFAWTVGTSEDSQSGIAGYYLEVGTQPVGTVFYSEDVGNTLSKTLSDVNGIVTGRTYYAKVRARSGAGAYTEYSPVSAGINVDATVPSAIAAVRDGLAADISQSSSTSVLSANWDASTDFESGIYKYWYRLVNSNMQSVRGWTDVGTSTSVTVSGLNLENNLWYMFVLRAENKAGLTNNETWSNGILIDLTPPNAVPAINDQGVYTSSSTQFSASWNASNDIESGTIAYWYTLGTTPGGADVIGWTNNSTNLGILRTGLSLSNGTTYYLSVKVENSLNMFSNAAISDGIMVDITVPAGTPGTPQDEGVYANSNMIKFTWTAGTAADTQSGISGYVLDVGTTINGNDIQNGAYIGNVLSTTTVIGNVTVPVYARIRARNGAGLLSAFSLSSDGIQVDSSAPDQTSIVRDGLSPDLAYSRNTTELSANWENSADNESGLNSYWYAIGTMAGDNNVVNWTSVELSTNVTKTGLSLVEGAYFFSVKAKNNAGLFGAAQNSNGITVDMTKPEVRDSDNDGESDKQELAGAKNPYDANSNLGAAVFYPLDSEIVSYADFATTNANTVKFRLDDPWNNIAVPSQIDINASTVTVTGPAKSWVFSGSNLPITLNLNANDTKSYYRTISCVLNPLVSDNGTDDGLYTVTVRTQDLAGNIADMVTRRFTLDSVKPEITAGANASAGNTVSGISLSITATDASGIQPKTDSVQVIISSDGPTVNPITYYMQNAGGGVYSYNFIPTILNPATYYYYFLVKDNAGTAPNTGYLPGNANNDTSRRFTFFIADKTPPDVTLSALSTLSEYSLAGGSPKTSYSTAEIRNLPTLYSDGSNFNLISATVPAGTPQVVFEYKISTASVWTSLPSFMTSNPLTWSSSWSVTGLPVNIYYDVRAKAVDLYGNWTVPADNTSNAWATVYLAKAPAPTATIDSAYNTKKLINGCILNGSLLVINASPVTVSGNQDFASVTFQYKRNTDPDTAWTDIEVDTTPVAMPRNITFYLNDSDLPYIKANYCMDYADYTLRIDTIVAVNFVSSSDATLNRPFKRTATGWEVTVPFMSGTSYNYKFDINVGNNNWISTPDPREHRTSILYRLSRLTVRPFAAVWNVSGLISGIQYDVRGKAADSRGNTDSNPAKVTFTYDSTGPSAPEIVQPVSGSRVKDNTATVLNALSSSADTAVVFYEVSYDSGITWLQAGVDSGLPWSQNWTAPDITVDGIAKVRAWAFDTVWNRSAASVESHFVIDANLPVISKFSIQGTTATITLNGGSYYTAEVRTADTDVEYVTLTRATLAATWSDGTSAAAKTVYNKTLSGGEYVFTEAFYVTNTGDANGTLSAQLTDKAANNSTALSLTINIKDVTPNIATIYSVGGQVITDGASGYIGRTAVTTVAKLVGETGGLIRLQYATSASPNTWITIGDTNNPNASTAGTNNNLTSWDTLNTGITPGTYYLRAVAVDDDNNIDPSPKSVTVVVDHTPPTAVVSVPSTLNPAEIFTISALAADSDIGMVTFQYLDPANNTWTTITNATALVMLINATITPNPDLNTPYSVTAVASGIRSATNLKFRARATDRAGNSDTSETYSPTAVCAINDTSAPLIRGIRVNSTNGSWYASTDDANILSLLFQYRKQGDSSWTDAGTDTGADSVWGVVGQEWTSPLALSGLAAGSYELRAIPTDMFGNSSAAIQPVTTAVRRVSDAGAGSYETAKSTLTASLSIGIEDLVFGNLQSETGAITGKVVIKAASAFDSAPVVTLFISDGVNTQTSKITVISSGTAKYTGAADFSALAQSGGTAVIYVTYSLGGKVNTDRQQISIGAIGANPTATSDMARITGFNTPLTNNAAAAVFIAPAVVPETPAAQTGVVSPVSNRVYQFKLSDGTKDFTQGGTVSNWATARIDYMDSDIPSSREDNLGIAYWDDTLSKWTASGIMNVERDKINNRVYFNTSHFSKFAVIVTTVVPEIRYAQPSSGGYSSRNPIIEADFIDEFSAIRSYKIEIDGVDMTAALINFASSDGIDNNGDGRIDEQGGSVAVTTDDEQPTAQTSATSLKYKARAPMNFSVGEHTVKFTVFNEMGQSSQQAVKFTVSDDLGKLKAYNTPNPFKNQTKIKFTLTSGNNTSVTMKVYDFAGKLVSLIKDKDVITSGVAAAGIEWAGMDDETKKPLANGVYFCLIEVKDEDKNKIEREFIKIAISR